MYKPEGLRSADGVRTCHSGAHWPRRRDRSPLGASRPFAFRFTPYACQRGGDVRSVVLCLVSLLLKSLSSRAKSRELSEH